MLSVFLCANKKASNHEVASIKFGQLQLAEGENLGTLFHSTSNIICVNKKWLFFNHKEQK